ncbi:MAG: hypothetical protein QOI65_2230, partial [Thermoleophilaceae bacterium]|nr:hypothetical protein [Thermoleophilaceae bacterium]
MCGSSNNDVTGVSASGITIDDRTDYSVQGNAITLGAGGVTTTANGPGGSTIWGIPITLGASQTWSLDGGAGFSGGALFLQAAITGASANSLAVDLSHNFALYLSGDDEVGPLTVTGDGSNTIVAMGSSLNGTDGDAVGFSGGANLFVLQSGSVGPLTMSAGEIGLGGSAPSKLSVGGTASLDGSSTLLAYITPSSSAPTPGVNYSQLSASGNVVVAGQLYLNEGVFGSCDGLTPGDEYTLVETTGGSLTGTFSNAPEGSIAQVVCNNGGDGPSVRIHYTSTAVTATPVAVTTLSTT